MKQCFKKIKFCHPLSRFFQNFQPHHCWIAKEQLMKVTAKNTVISPDFLMWKFCGKAKFPHSFGRFARNYAETVPLRKIFTPGNQLKLWYFSQWVTLISSKQPWHVSFAKYFFARYHCLKIVSKIRSKFKRIN